ncbi:MAG: MATE family efflux transporter [Gammaproteobacteria bacterium]|nr:MATE family efflux transporter [Gammaproteobacteria bacterium]
MSSGSRAEPTEASDQTEQTSQGEVVQLKIWELAWPTILSNLLFSVIGIISIKIVGELGSEAVAAVTTGHRIFFAVQAILMAVSTGTTAMVARAWGANNPREAASVTSASLWTGNLVALALTAPCFFFALPIASIFGLNEATTQLTADFIRYLSIFNVAFSVNMILGAALRAAGDTRTPLWIGAFMNVVNVILVYALVYGEWGFPEMGTNGAALASGFSFTAAAIVLLGLWYGKRLIVGVGGKGAFTLRRISQLYQIGYPAAITAPYAAYGIGVQILSVSFVVGFGFSIAGATLVGQYLGAGDPEGARRQGWRATRLAIFSMMILSALILPFAHELASALINEPDVIRYTVIFIYILGAAQPLMGVEFSLSGCLRGAGDTRYPLLTTMVGLIGVRVGLAALFMSMNLSVTWIFAALLGDYLIKALMLTHRFKSGRWKNKMKRFDQVLG